MSADQVFDLGVEVKTALYVLGHWFIPPFRFAFSHINTPVPQGHFFFQFHFGFFGLCVRRRLRLAPQFSSAFLTGVLSTPVPTQFRFRTKLLRNPTSMTDCGDLLIQLIEFSVNLFRELCPRVVVLAVYLCQSL